MPPLCGAGHIDPGHTLEDVDSEILTNLKPLDRATKLAYKPLRLAVGLGERNNSRLGLSLTALALEIGNLPARRATGETTRFVEKPDLNGRVAVTLERAEAKNRARPGFDDGDRHHTAVSIEHLCHSHLPPQQSLGGRTLGFESPSPTGELSSRGCDDSRRCGDTGRFLSSHVVRRRNAPPHAMRGAGVASSSRSKLLAAGAPDHPPRKERVTKPYPQRLPSMPCRTLLKVLKKR